MSLNATTLSRRQALTRISALTAIAATAVIPATAVAIGSAEPDPIFAAIESHRAASAVYCSCCVQLSDTVLYEKTIAAGRPWDFPFIPGTPEADEELHRISGIEDAAATTILTTPPKTIAGVVALLRYILKFEDWQTPANWVVIDDDGTEQSWLDCALEMLADALCEIHGTEG
jgi:hypothetical protein